MALILCIETSLSNCSVALSLDGKVVSIKEKDGSNLHASHLHLFIKEVLDESAYHFNQLSAIAVSAGPGSYTGLRIGVSAAKGLCYALDIPLIAVSTLQAMASGVPEDVDTSALLCPMIDARRMEVYYAIYDKQLNTRVEPLAAIIEPGFFDQLLESHKVVFFGNGMAKCKEIIRSANAIFIDDFTNSAKYLAKLAEAKFNKDDFVNLSKFEPDYLKEFKAGSPKDQIAKLLGK